MSGAGLPESSSATPLNSEAGASSRRLHITSHDKVSRVFSAYGKCVTRLPAVALVVGLLIVTGLSLGLLLSEREKNVDELWVEKGTRLRDERSTYNKYFGGLGRKQFVALTSRTSSGSAVSKDALDAMMEVLTPILAPNDTSYLSLESDISGNMATYHQSDFCERGSVPNVLKSGVISGTNSTSEIAWAYQRVTQCLDDDFPSFPDALPSGWGIDEFPCPRISPLDCFSEGDFDYPEALAQLDLVARAVADTAADDLQTCLNEMKVDAVTNFGVDDSRADTLISHIQYIWVPLFARWGYTWRSSYSGMTDDDLLDYFRNVSDTVPTNITNCINEGVPCCVTWDGLPVAEDIFLGGFSADKASASQTILLNFNENHPSFAEQIGVSSKSHRLRLVEKWERTLIDYLKPMHGRDRGSDFASGETFGKFRLHFMAWRSPQDAINTGSAAQYPLIIVGAALMVAYSLWAFTFFRKIGSPAGRVYSRTTLSIGGVFAVIAAVVAGFGLMGYIGLKQTAVSINLVPFLSFGLGVFDYFVLTHALLNYAHRPTVEERIEVALASAGPSILLTTLSNTAAFLMAALTPIPAVQTLCIQLGLTSLIVFISLMSIYVPFMVWDSKRVAAHHVDPLFCCCPGVAASDVPPEEKQEYGQLTVLFIRSHFAPFLTRLWVKIAVIVLAAGITAVLLWNGIANSNVGLPLSDLTLRGTYVRDYIDLQERLFNGYDNYVITNDIDFGAKQQELLDVQDALRSSKWVSDQMRVRDRSWLSDQPDSLLGFYAGIGTVANPETPLADASLFEAYFESWVGTGVTSFGTDLYCRNKDTGERRRCEEFSKTDDELAAVRSVVFNVNLDAQSDFTDAIRNNRRKVDSVKGSGSFVYGYVYQYYEQYLRIWNHLFETLGYSLIAVFCVVLAFQFSISSTFLVLAMIILTQVQLIGFLNLINVRINAFSVVNLCFALGLSVEFTAHVAHVFLVHGGDRNNRMMNAVNDMMAPMINGAVASFLAVVPVAFSDFPFFRDYFFGMFAMMIVFAFFNGLVLLPVLLSFIGASSFSWEETASKEQVELKKLVDEGHDPVQESASPTTEAGAAPPNDEESATVNH